MPLRKQLQPHVQPPGPVDGNPLEGRARGARVPPATWRRRWRAPANPQPGAGMVAAGLRSLPGAEPRSGGRGGEEGRWPAASVVRRAGAAEGQTGMPGGGAPLPSFVERLRLLLMPGWGRRSQLCRVSGVEVRPALSPVAPGPARATPARRKIAASAESWPGPAAAVPGFGFLAWGSGTSEFEFGPLPSFPGDS
ncbi:unnamed protein product [Rangifer tarandus platyrhynchus]|uniref:Uncharacterized protein n=1 Tax=Rangifer tarandus platyrhynchus TaxID=3082113 RepID=A0AC59Z0J7_RANTA